MSESNVRQVSLISDAIGTMAVRMLGIGLVFLTTAVLAPVLGPQQYGSYCAGMALAIVLASLAPLGTDRVLTRNLATNRDPVQSARETAVSHAATLLCCGLVLTLGSLQFLFRHRLPFSAAWLESCLLASIVFVPLTLTNLRQWIAIPLIGTRKAVIPEQTLLPISFLGTIGVLHVCGIRISALSAATAYAGVGTVVWSLSLLNPTIRSAYSMALRQPPAFSSVSSAIAEALPFVNVSVGGILLQRCTPLITAETCGFHETGHYSVALQLAALPALPMGVATLVILPRCSRLFSQNDHSGLNRTIRRSATMTFVFAVGIAAALWFSRPALLMIFGSEYARVLELLPFLLIAGIVETLAGPTMAFMQAMRVENLLARSILLFIPVQLGSVYVFSLWLGAEGAALGLILSRSVWVAMTIWIIASQHRIVSLPSPGYLQLPVRIPWLDRLNSTRLRETCQRP